MVGLLHPTNGEVIIDGYNPWKRKHDYLKNVAIVMGQKINYGGIFRHLNHFY